MILLGTMMVPKEINYTQNAVMKYGNSTCEGASIALSTHLSTMAVLKNIWEEKYEV